MEEIVLDCKRGLVTGKGCAPSESISLLDFGVCFSEFGGSRAALGCGFSGLLLFLLKSWEGELKHVASRRFFLLDARSGGDSCERRLAKEKLKLRLCLLGGILSANSGKNP